MKSETNIFLVEEKILMNTNGNGNWNGNGNGNTNVNVSSLTDEDKYSSGRENFDE